jgi:hypothetical protein
MIACAHTRHTFTDFAHDACALMSENERRARRPVASCGVKIAVANAGCLNFNQDFTSVWCLEFGFLNRKGCALFP